MRQASEVTSLQTKTLVALRRAMIKIQQLAYVHTTDFQLKPKELEDVRRELRDAQVAAHLVAVARVRKQAKLPASLQLALPSGSPGYSTSLADTLSRFRNITSDQIQALESRYDQSTLKVLQTLSTDLTARVRMALNDAVESQVTPRVAVANFFSKQGLTDSNFYYFENLLRTQTQLVYGAARWEEYQNPIIDEILWGYEYLTVGDERVREEHAILEGTKLPKDDSFWYSFFHLSWYNWRCQAVPVFDKEAEKQPPKDAKPDKGFDFNPGQLGMQNPGQLAAPSAGELKPTVTPPAPAPPVPALSVEQVPMLPEANNQPSLIRRAIANKLIDEEATLQIKYNRFSKALDEPGVDVPAVKQILEEVSAQLDNVRSQLELVS